MKEEKHVMLDIETLGDTNNSVIVSIGAVKFNLKNGQAFGDDFYEVVDIDSCLKAGLEITGSTTRWWMKQSDEARKVFEERSVPLGNALRKFANFFDTRGYMIWSNGLRFDVAILENAYRKMGIPVPWIFRNEMDVRTLVAFAPEIKAATVKSWNQVLHNALDDCHLQIKYCSEIYNKIKI